MTESKEGVPGSRLETDQGTPIEISSTSGQMNASPKNTPLTGTRNKMYLLDCNEDIVTGEINYCRRIPIYDNPKPATVIDIPGSLPPAPPSASRQAVAKSGCTQTKCEVPRQLRKRLGENSPQKSNNTEVQKKD